MEEFSRWFAGLTPGTKYSALLHFFVLLFLLFGAPMLFQEYAARENTVVVLVDLPVRDITNVKTEPPKQQEKKEPPKPKPEPKEEKPKEKKPEPKPELKPEVKEAVPLPDAKPKPKEEKPKEKKPDKDVKKQPDFDEILKDLAQTAEEEKKKQPEEKTFDDVLKGVNAQGQYNPALPLSVSQLDAIRSQIARCWNVPAGVKDDHTLIVVLRLSVARTGAVTDVDYENKTRYNRDAVFRAAVDSAVRAVRLCSPLKNLPPDKYDSWREMELTFDPKDMLY